MREGEREGRERIFGERERICLAAEEMVRVSEFLPFILAFLGDDSVKIVGLFCKNRRPRESWPTIFEVVALFFENRRLRYYTWATMLFTINLVAQDEENRRPRVYLGDDVLHYKSRRPR